MVAPACSSCMSVRLTWPAYTARPFLRNDRQKICVGLWLHMLVSPSLALSTLPVPGPLWYGAPAALSPSFSRRPPLAGVRPSAPSHHQGDSAVTWKRRPHSSDAARPAHPEDNAVLKGNQVSSLSTGSAQTTVQL